MEKFKKALKLFLIFFKIGLTTFGGGYAMISVFEEEFVSKRNYLTQSEMLEMIAISESTPGPIAINAAPMRSTPITQENISAVTGPTWRSLYS